MRSPFPSIGAVPSRPVSFATMLTAVVRWITNRQLPPRSEVQLEAKIVAKLVEELELELEPEASLDKPKLQPNRPRRRDVGL
jgi:hypothetical protein